MSALGQFHRGGADAKFGKYGVDTKPYGQAAEDQPHLRPFNVSDETVIVKVRNLSALRPRKLRIDSIGLGRGGEVWAQQQAEKGRQVNLDLLWTQFAKFGDAREISPTEMRLEPIDAILTWAGQTFVVEAKDDKGKPAPWLDVPEGVFDLYFGNWRRLFEMGPQERSKELEVVRTRRRDYCVRDPRGEEFMRASDNETADKNNPWAFLVFERKVVKPEAVAVDMERVYAGHAMEV